MTARTPAAATTDMVQVDANMFVPTDSGVALFDTGAKVSVVGSQVEQQHRARLVAMGFVDPGGVQSQMPTLVGHDMMQRLNMVYNSQQNQWFMPAVDMSNAFLQAQSAENTAGNANTPCPTCQSITIVGPDGLVVCPSCEWEMLPNEDSQL